MLFQDLLHQSTALVYVTLLQFNVSRIRALISLTENLQTLAVAVVTLVTTATALEIQVSLVEVTTTLTEEIVLQAAVHLATILVQPATAGRSILAAQVTVLLPVAAAVAVRHQVLLQVKVEALQAAAGINS